MKNRFIKILYWLLLKLQPKAISPYLELERIVNKTDKRITISIMNSIDKNILNHDCNFVHFDLNPTQVHKLELIRSKINELIK